MAYLKGFGLENFRVFKDYAWFDFAPITILVGPNSSGKSSLIKALLLLQDNIKKGNLPPTFHQVGEGYSQDWGSGETDYNDYNEVFEPSILEFDGRVHGMNGAVSIKNKKSNSDTFQVCIEYNIESGKEKNDEEFNLENMEIIFRKERRRWSLISKPMSEGEKAMSDLMSDEGIKAIKEKLGEDPPKVVRTMYKTLHRTVKYKLTFTVDTDGEAKTKSKLELLTDKDNCFLKITDYEVFFFSQAL